MKLRDFLNAALEPTRGQRRGQWFANLLHTVDPALANRLIAVDVDPFYDDGKLWAAVQFVTEHWADDRAPSHPSPQEPKGAHRDDR
jgi:hypothetical protein